MFVVENVLLILVISLTDEVQVGASNPSLEMGSTEAEQMRSWFFIV